MASSGLSSDALNYLIWRYLQESGHGQAAAKLQQYWLRDPQELPFAPKIERKALISLVQKGLKYHQIEHNKTAAKYETSPAAFYFGPETRRVRASSDDGLSHSGLAQSTAINGFKESEFERTNVQPGLKQAGHVHTSLDRNGIAESKSSDLRFQQQPLDASHQAVLAGQNGDSITAMDIDEDSSPAAAAHLISTLIDGSSVAIQSESVRNLEPVSSTFAFPERVSIMHAVWHPDPQHAILAVGGVGLCQLLHFSDRANTKEPRRIDVFESSEVAMVSSMAWSPDGTIIAIAARSDSADSAANVSTWTKDGECVDELSAAQDLVIKLRWNSRGTMLLGITATGDESSSLIAWDMRTLDAFSVECGSVITDAIWALDNIVRLCGGRVFGRWDIWSQEGISWAHKAAPELAEREWTHIFYEPSTEFCHVFAEDHAHIASVSNLDVVGDTRRIHGDSITQISGGYPRPVFVTSSLDGAVKVWDHHLRPVSTLQFGQDSPPLTAALTGQSTFLAAASQNKVLVWDASGRSVPIGSLKVDLGKVSKVSLPNGNNADKDSGIGDDATEDGLSEPSVCLDWDAAGKRLALGITNQIVIIDVVT